jgi:hypothetical protein
MPSTTTWSSLWVTGSGCASCTGSRSHLIFKTPDFERKLESLYHRDSPWISGYHVQNVSQINTQSHTSHHATVKVHNLLHVHYGVHYYRPLG